MAGLPFTQLPAYTEIPSGQVEIIKGRQRSFETFGISPQSQQPQGRLDPFTMVDRQFQTDQRNLFNYFDQARYALDQQDLDPKEYLQQLDALHDNIRRAEFSLKSKAEAQIESMGQIVRLMQEKRLDVKSGQRAAFRLAGLDEQTLDAMFPPEPKPVDPMALHAQIVAEQSRLENTLNMFSSGKDGKLYYTKVDSKGYYIPNTPDKKHPASPEEERIWLLSKEAYNTLRTSEQDVLSQMSPWQQTAFAGIEAMKRRLGVGQVPEKSWAAKAGLPTKWWEFIPPVGIAKMIAGATVPGMIYRASQFRKEEPISNKIKVRAPDGREGTMSETEWRQKRTNLETEGWSII